MSRSGFEALGILTVLFTSIFLAGTILPFAGLMKLASPVSVQSTVAPQATQDNISYNGVGPTTISLSWAQSGDVCFSYYTLQYSLDGANGTYYTQAILTAQSATVDYAYDRTPSQTYWWQILDTDCVGFTATSNALQVTQPANATLSYTMPNATGAQFTWTNNALYGGLVSFGSYQLMESVNGGSYTAAATITSRSSMSYTLNGLSAGTGYSFHLVTTDQCGSCSGGPSPSSSNSNTVTFNTSSPLSASASALPVSANVGQLVSFTCVAAGGVAPYTYAWAFGDGITGTGQNPSHAYTSSGSMNAVCTVTDSTGSTAKSATVVIILAPAPAILGLTQYDGYALIAGIIAVGAIVSAVLIRRRKTASASTLPTP